jgi:hypothetical protein
MKEALKYKSVKLEVPIYLKLQYLKKKHKAKSLSKLLDNLTEGK